MCTSLALLFYFLGALFSGFLKRLNSLPRTFLFCCLWLAFNAGFTGSAYAMNCADESGADSFCQTQHDPGIVRTQGTLLRHVGNPVDVITGAKQQREIDFQSLASPLHFSRYYYSNRDGVNAGLGRNWRHTYQVTLFSIDSNRLQIQLASGRRVDFQRIQTQTNSDIYKANSESEGYIIVGDEPEWYVPDGRIYQFKGSWLAGIRYPDNRRLQLKYRNARLHSVADSHGAVLRFHYIQSTQPLSDFDSIQAGRIPGLLSHVELPSGKFVRYFYDEHANLINVVFAEGETTHYQYGLTDFPSHLTEIKTQNHTGISTRRWTYDQQGRVARFESAQPKHSLNMRYPDMPDVAGVSETQVTFDDGKAYRYRWREDKPTHSSRVFELAMRDCINCPSVLLKSETQSGQSEKSVLDAIANRQSGKVKKNSESTSAIADSNGRATFMELSELEAVPHSLDYLGDVDLAGVKHRFRFEVNRTGEVVDVAVGNTSLFKLKEKWREGNIERCDSEPLLERTRFNPEPAQGCLEDLIYLIELIEHVHRIGPKASLSDVRDLHRSANSPNPAAQCLVNPFASCDELERNFELAQLSSCAYGPPLPGCGSDWQVISAASVGLSTSSFDNGSFASTLFYNAVTDEYVLAFRGTDDFADWKDNLLQASGRASDQYKAAVSLAQTVQGVLPNARLSFTGHSLGGGLATAAALAIDSTASVFNPASLHPDTASELGLDYNKAALQVEVTTVDGDLLTAIQEPKPDKSQWIQRYRAPGQHTMVAAPSNAWVEQQQAAAGFLAGAKGVILHAIEAVMETQQELLLALCGTTPERV